MTTRTRVSVPTVYRDVEVSLSDFDLDDIREYLRAVDEDTTHPDHDPLKVPDASEALVIHADDIDRISTLALCGQQQHARDYLAQLVSRHIGRKL